MGIIIKTEEINVSKEVEKLKPSYIAGGNLKWCSCYGKLFDSYSKVKELDMTQQFYS